MRDFSIPVALDTKTHIERFFHTNAVHFFHISVTFAAINARLYMRLMTEKYEFLKNIHTIPLDGHIMIIIAAKFRYRWIVCYYFTVAQNA